jgi:hypothetical protein
VTILCIDVRQAVPDLLRQGKPAERGVRPRKPAEDREQGRTAGARVHVKALDQESKQKWAFACREGQVLTSPPVEGVRRSATDRWKPTSERFGPGDHRRQCDLHVLASQFTSGQESQIADISTR